MEHKKHKMVCNVKPKMLRCTPEACSIQPRVVLQRLSKDYTLAAASGSDNQPSTSGYLRPKSNSPEVDDTDSDDTSDSFYRLGKKKKLVIPCSSLPTPSRLFSNRKKAEFRVAPLRIANWEEIEGLRKKARAAPVNSPPTSPPSPSHRSPPPSPTGSSSSSSSDCSYHSSTKEVVDVEEDKTDSGECEKCLAEEGYGSISSGSILSEENHASRFPRDEAKIKRAISFLKLLIEAYGKRFKRRTVTDISTSENSPIPSPAPPVRPSAGRNIVLGTQQSNLKDCLVRVWLSIRGQNKKKKFHVRLSQLISLLNNKHHPLHKFRNTLNLRTMGYLSEGELRVMAKVLAGFICAKPVKY